MLLLIPYLAPGQQAWTSGRDLLGKGCLGETISTQARNLLARDVSDASQVSFLCCGCFFKLTTVSWDLKLLPFTEPICPYQPLGSAPHQQRAAGTTAQPATGPSRAGLCPAHVSAPRGNQASASTCHPLRTSPPGHRGRLASPSPLPAEGCRAETSSSCTCGLQRLLQRAFWGTSSPLGSHACPAGLWPMQRPPLLRLCPLAAT